MPLQPEVTSLVQKSSALTVKNMATKTYNHFIFIILFSIEKNRKKRRTKKHTRKKELKLFVSEKTNYVLCFGTPADTQIKKILFLFCVTPNNQKHNN